MEVPSIIPPFATTPVPDPPLYKGGTGNILNTPVYSDLRIASGNYIDNDGTLVSYPALLIPQVLIHAQQTKLIIKTPIQGLSGTVKQYISEGDWVINVKGLALGGNNIYPSILVDKLNQVLKAGVALQINSDYLGQFGIYNIVVTDKSFPQEAGKYSQQVFEFNALSDVPIELF